jgi:3-keto-5-aminohexanoate cleavage enzyme
MEDEGSMSETETTPRAGLWEAAEREMREYQFAGDLRAQPTWDIPKKMALQVALAGRFSADEGAQHPTTVDDFLEDARTVIKAGASGIHLDFGFLYDDEGRRLDLHYPPTQLFGSVINPLRKQFGNQFVSNVNVLSGKTFEDCMSPAREGLCEVAPCAAGHPIDFAVPAVDALQQAGVKPEIVIHSPGEIELAKRRFIDTGLLQKPYYFIILYGLPFESGRSLLAGTWVRNTQDMAIQLFLMVNQIKGLDEDAQITVCAGGRSTFYMTTLATMLGLHVRVGTEDTIWRSPLSDELVESNVEMVERARAIAELHGREVATADEYRAVIGLKPRG